MLKKIILTCVIGCMSVLPIKLSANPGTGLTNSSFILFRNSTKGNGSSNGGGPRSPILFPEVYASIYHMVLTVDATNLSDDVDVTITNEDGVAVFSGNYSTTSAFDIYLTSLPTGIYTLTIETETLIYEGEFEI